jgi:uncharacterized membrane protein
MAFCGKCGSAVNEGTAFCPQCGATIAAPAAQPYSPPYVPPVARSGMQENVAGMLCYAFGWVTGIIFLLIDKRPFVRFHAAQSIVVFGALHIIQIVLAYAWIGTVSYGAGGWGLHWMLSSLISLLSFIAWIVLMVMAYQGKRFEVPVAAGIAQSLAGKV